MIVSFGSAVVFIYKYRYILIPNRTCKKQSKYSISVMTYNVLESNRNLDGIVNSILSSNPDVIAFQEITNNIGEKLSELLSHIYPFQEFASRLHDFPTNAFISKYPFKMVDSIIEGYWKTPPQVLIVDFNGSPFYFINIHANPTRIGTINSKEIAHSFNLRLQQVEAIVRHISQIKMPLIIAGDLNSTEYNYAYTIITDQLQDVWRSAGWGLGYTFGLRNNTFMDRRPLKISSCIPRWMLRIDFIFYSNKWMVPETHTGKWDNVSDHRPVIANFILNS